MWNSKHSASGISAFAAGSIARSPDGGLETRAGKKVARCKVNYAERGCDRGARRAERNYSWRTFDAFNIPASALFPSDDRRRLR